MCEERYARRCWDPREVSDHGDDATITVSLTVQECRALSRAADMLGDILATSGLPVPLNLETADARLLAGLLDAGELVT
jgi:hypothetical protein